MPARVTQRATDLTPLFVGAGLPAPVREYRFLEKRRFRWDYAWADKCDLGGLAGWIIHPKIALEIQGGIWTRGRHSRGPGQESDWEKLALGNLDGWTVFFASTGQVNSGQAVEWIRQALLARGWKP